MDVEKHNGSKFFAYKNKKFTYQLSLQSNQGFAHSLIHYIPTNIPIPT
jgi:hypothetical protein